MVLAKPKGVAILGSQELEFGAEQGKEEEVPCTGPEWGRWTEKAVLG
jgi:hypothetical protein